MVFFSDETRAGGRGLVDDRRDGSVAVASPMRSGPPEVVDDDGMESGARASPG